MNSNYDALYLIIWELEVRNKYIKDFLPFFLYLPCLLCSFWWEKHGAYEIHEQFSLLGKFWAFLCEALSIFIPKLFFSLGAVWIAEGKIRKTKKYQFLLFGCDEKIVRK